MEAQLKIITKTEKGQEVRPAGVRFSLDWGQEKYTIGREPINSIMIPSDLPGARHVSRRHCQLEVHTVRLFSKETREWMADDSFQITDPESSNRTYLEVFEGGHPQAVSPVEKIPAPGVNCFYLNEIGPGDGVRVWLGPPPQNIGKSAIVLDIFDSRPPLRTPEGSLAGCLLGRKGRKVLVLRPRSVLFETSSEFLYQTMVASRHFYASAHQRCCNRHS